MTLPWQMFSLVLSFFSFSFFFYKSNQHFSSEWRQFLVCYHTSNGDDFFLFRMCRAVSPPILVTHYFFPSLKNAEKNYEKFALWKQLMKATTKKIITTVKNLFTFYFHTQQSTSDWLTFRVVLRSKFIFAIRLHCCKTNDSSFT